ncbi:MAG: prepilin-type N-terminal cleavage/methylation domain-containing protein [Candidatus Hydrogenedentes bacterium]|nr:prepilin-type N-terminal cleavage/methylation domain-containing protein [Candidatus Hydrogenedentota bacterium]
MKKTLHRGHDRAGFTLMEVMVASILITVVMTSVYVLFNSTITSWKTVERGYDVHKEGRNFTELFQREVNNLLPEAEHLFTGEDEELTMFVVSEPLEVDETSGKHLLRVRYRYNGGRNEVVREEALVEAALPQPTNEEDHEIDRTRVKVGHEEEYVVAENVTDFELRYLWLPLPDEPRDKLAPPAPIDPLVLAEHRELWRVGYPHAIEVRMTLQDPGDKKKHFAVKMVAQIHVHPKEWTRRRLTERVGSAL